MKNKRISFGSHATVFDGSNAIAGTLLHFIVLSDPMKTIAWDPKLILIFFISGLFLPSHGGHHFINLYTGKKFHSYHWQELPIDDETIDRVGELGMNPYDICVANKFINEKQCTIVFHVDDKYFVDLAATRGRSHDFLGINIFLGEDGLVKISQHDQVQEALNKFGETYGHHVSSPCANHLWDVNENAEKLSKEKSDLFHSIVAKLLYITKRSRPDIVTAVAFLTTRVSKNDVDDWKN